MRWLNTGLAFTAGGTRAFVYPQELMLKSEFHTNSMAQSWNYMRSVLSGVKNNMYNEFSSNSPLLALTIVTILSHV